VSEPNFIVISSLMLFRAWSPWHVLRHNCGYKLANDGYDTRAIQHASTVRYTALAPDRFKRGSGKTRALALAEIGGVLRPAKKAPGLSGAQ